MIVTKSELPDSQGGYLVLPRRIGFAIVVGGIAYASGIGWVASGYANRLEALERFNARFERERAESRADTDRRIARLEQSQERIARIEEQVRNSAEMIKEIRDELRQRSKVTP